MVEWYFSPSDLNHLLKYALGGQKSSCLLVNLTQIQSNTRKPETMKNVTASFIHKLFPQNLAPLGLSFAKIKWLHCLNLVLKVSVLLPGVVSMWDADGAVVTGQVI